MGLNSGGPVSNQLRKRLSSAVLEPKRENAVWVRVFSSLVAIRSSWRVGIFPKSWHTSAYSRKNSSSPIRGVFAFGGNPASRTRSECFAQWYLTSDCGTRASLQKAVSPGETPSLRRQAWKRSRISCRLSRIPNFPAALLRGDRERVEVDLAGEAHRTEREALDV